MKVIKTGNIRQATCTGEGNGGKGCGALLEIEDSDLKYFEGVSGDSWGSRDPAVMFKCPCCEAITDLKRTKCPQNVNKLPRYHSSSRSWGDQTND